ncbi:MAG: SDR family oxidoreductase [Actinomycetota bacterium]|nr:SDR family oxidoreductase [Actinomycetota bacterium]
MPTTLDAPLNVLITGCSSGFGELAALTFADHGHRVFATMRTPGKSAALNSRPDIAQLALDVCDTASVEAAVGQAITEAGRLHVVVNNAGIELFGAVHLVSDDEVLQQMNTNVLGVVRVARAVVPHLIANGGGSFVNVGSIAGLVGTPYGGIYAASKHAVEAITEAMHFELSHLGIRVCVVEPGQFATNLGDNGLHAAAMAPDSAEAVRRERFRLAQRSLVNGQPANPQQVADAIYRAATARPGKLRHLVGGDAELIAVTKASMSFEDFDVTMRSALDFHD